MWRTAIGVGLLVAVCSPLFATQPAELGQPVPEWSLKNWLNSKPLKLSDLRGKVVLIRWWTAPGCRYCAHTAPALNEFHRAYAKSGLQVIGIYHHKSEDPLDPKHIERAAKKFGFKFPVATDPDWQTLNRWWLNHHDAPFTSMSFLLDRQGALRYIHPGGEYVKGDQDYQQIKEQIERLLDQRLSPGCSSGRESALTESKAHENQSRLTSAATGN